MSPNRGWVLILIGLLISSFIGGAIHVLLSPERITEFVHDLVDQYEPKFTIQFQNARLRLAEGWEPIVAIELDNVDFKAKDPCITGSEIYADHVIVPLQVIPLIDKKVRFGDIYAHNLKFQWRPPECRKQTLSQSVSGPHSADKNDDKISLLERFFHDRWNYEVANTEELLHGFDVTKFEFLVGGKILYFSANDFRAHFDTGWRQAIVHANIRLGQPWVGDAGFGEFRMTAKINASKIRVSGNGNLKEGQIAVDSQWNISTGNLKLRGNFTDLPIQRVLVLANHWGVLSAFHPELHDEWLSCDLSYDGDIRALPKGKLQDSQCRMYGDLGDWFLKTPTVQIQKPFPVKWHLVHVDVKKWLDGFGVGSTWGVVGRFGDFTGNLGLAGAEKLQIDGSLTGFSAYVVSKRNRAKLKVKNVNLNTKIQPNQISGELAHMQIENGIIGGLLNFTFNRAGTGQINFNLKNVRLPLTVQQVLWSGHAGATALVGTLKFKGFQMNQFDGNLAIQQLSLNPAGHWAALATKLISFVSPLNSLNKNLPAGIEWKHLRAHILYRNSIGHWQRFEAHAAIPNRFNIFTDSTGGWSNAGQLTGRIFIKSFNDRYRAIRSRVVLLSGSWQNPQLILPAR